MYNQRLLPSQRVYYAYDGIVYIELLLDSNNIELVTTRLL